MAEVADALRACHRILETVDPCGETYEEFEARLDRECEAELRAAASGPGARAGDVVIVHIPRRFEPPDWIP